MLPFNSGGHAAYQAFVPENLRKYYPNPTVFGPKPRTPSCMQRSYLLSIDFKVHSITGWAAQFKINPFFAILSGFDLGDTPGIDTFMTFSTDSGILTIFLLPEMVRLLLPLQENISIAFVSASTMA